MLKTINNNTKAYLPYFQIAASIKAYPYLFVCVSKSKVPYD